MTTRAQLLEEVRARGLVGHSSSPKSVLEKALAEDDLAKEKARRERSVSELVNAYLIDVRDRSRGPLKKSILDTRSRIEALLLHLESDYTQATELLEVYAQVAGQLVAKVELWKQGRLTEDEMLEPVGELRHLLELTPKIEK